MQAKYRVVRVGDVERELNDATQAEELDAKENWKKTKSNKDNSCTLQECQALAYSGNAVVHAFSNMRFPTNHFFESFHRAYNEHLDVVDDVWTVISLQFSAYVNTNATKMRSMFVSHERRMEFTVETPNDLPFTVGTNSFN
jgi:hypothetical protein